MGVDVSPDDNPTSPDGQGFVLTVTKRADR